MARRRTANKQGPDLDRKRRPRIPLMKELGAGTDKTDEHRMPEDSEHAPKKRVFRKRPPR